MNNENNSINNSINEHILANVQKILSDRRLQEKKQKFAGRKVLLCDSGKKGECDSECVNLTLNDKCGFHRRKDIQEQLKNNLEIIPYIFDDQIDKSDHALVAEKELIEKENIELIVIFPNSAGTQSEFGYFNKHENLRTKILLFVNEEYFPYFGEEGIFTSEIKEFSFRYRGHVIIVKKDINLYKLIEKVLSDYFRLN